MSQTFEKGLLKSGLLVGSKQVEINGRKEALPEFIASAGKAGVTSIVLNAIAMETDGQPQKVAMTLEVKEACRQFNLPLIVDDDFELAQQVSADGLLIQQDPDTLKDIVASVNNNMFIGYYCDDLGKVDYVNQISQIDYAVVSNDESAKELIARCQKPVAISGGITEDQLQGLKDMGASGVMSTDIFTNSSDPAATVIKVNQVFK